MMPLNIRLLGLVGLVVGLGVAAMAAIHWLRGSDPGAPSAAEAASPPQWQYATVADARTASLQSRNRLKQPAPFKGGPATLGIARGLDGYAVRLDVDGDMACSYAPAASQVQVSFDGGPPRTFACAPAPDDHDKLLFDGAHSTAYLADPVAFLARLRNARSVRIASDFAGQSAPQTMEFTLPPGDPVAGVSPGAVEQAAVAQPMPAPVFAPAPAVEQVEAAPVITGNPVHARVTRPAHAAVRLAAHRRHPRGYYLHPYRPVSLRLRHHRH